MDAKRLMDEVLAMLSTIRDDKHKLAILHEFMMDSIYEEPEKEEIPDRYKKIVQDMAGSLQAGFICFFNPDTLEVEAIPKDLIEDPEEYELITGETWESEERKHEDWEKSIEIAPLDSNESFKIMEHFTKQVDNHHLQNKLISALNNRRPFANFKVLVENSEYREQWFEFRQKAYELYIWDLIQVDLEESD
ncbi:MAG: UPF0158 family protein [Cyclobacteriaceae bacterium]